MSLPRELEQHFRAGVFLIGMGEFVE